MIGIVDYGLGNTQAFANIYKRLNIPAVKASTPEVLREADKIILPGVGAFDWAMQCLERAGLRETIDELVMVDKRPVLGVCVGMQMMAKSSEEGVVPGLGWIDAEVKRFYSDTNADNLVLPHMGWNDVASHGSCALMKELSTDARFYFLHSYFLSPSKQSEVIGVCDYGGHFACAVRSGNCYGVQFHPEKSHGWGIQLLRNFAEI